MKLAAVAGPLGALKDARNKLQADLSRIGPKLATLWPEIRLKRRNQAGWAIPAKPWLLSFRSSGLRRLRKPGFLSTVLCIGLAVLPSGDLRLGLGAFCPMNQPIDALFLLLMAARLNKGPAC